ncbi:hypothetical protein QSV08_03280 [Maribacter sp. BPC-D8]|uniref:hypothetical protein n=1 Tax=Maribacter sp. BPC-D8 TaxID=3053613 RepID=UPI002B45D996|nr:hypothetical protein [Maribacter sp. BPC-D8]WRI30266.1 hypothetical protein QSV08_03280 [Maribacter sp. BPC-D8]
MNSKNDYREWDIKTLQRIFYSMQLDGVKKSDTSTFDKSELVKEFEDYKSQILNESDRGLILIIAAYIEDVLKEVLEIKLIGGQKHKRELFNFNGPLGTFSSKIMMSFSIGLINSEEQFEINTIRKIRNEFAHTSNIIDLETQKINNLINGLKFHPNDIPNLSNKEKLIFSFSVVLGKLLSLKEMGNKLEEFQNKTISFDGFYNALITITQTRRK